MRGYQGLGEVGKGELLPKGCRVSVQGNEKILEIDSGDGYIIL